MHTDTKRKGANGHIGICTCISKKKSKFFSDRGQFVVKQAKGTLTHATETLRLH